jgi:hypothetical protein
VVLVVESEVVLASACPIVEETGKVVLELMKGGCFLVVLVKGAG